MFLVLSNNHGDVVQLIKVAAITADELEELQAEVINKYNQNLHESSMALAPDVDAVRRIIGRCNGE